MEPDSSAESLVAPEHVAAPRSFVVDVKRVVRRPPRRPALVLATGFLVLIAIGTVLLSLPFAAASGAWTDPVTALFTATSAVCVTGLVVVDTGTYWSSFGQVVIITLAQLGGFGFMTGSTLLLLLVVGRRTALSDRMGYLLLLRIAMASVAVTWSAIRPEALGTPFAVLAAVSVSAK